MRVHVSASAYGPVRFKGIAWVRPGPLTRHASPDDERVLTERVRSGQIPPDLRPVASTTQAQPWRISMPNLFALPISRRLLQRKKLLRRTVAHSISSWHHFD